MKKICTVFYLLLCYLTAHVATAQVKVWDKRFGGASDDNLRSMVATPDGGFLLGGTSDSGAGGDKSQASQGDVDYWVVKIDANGNKIWDKRFGGTLPDYLKTIIATSDGGFLLGGDSSSDANGDKSQAHWGDSDYWVVKIDANGNKVWDKRFGGTLADYLNTMIATSDGGFLLGGASNSGADGDKSQGFIGTMDYWVIKINESGNKIWDKRFGGLVGTDYLYSIVATSDGGFLLGGEAAGVGGDKSQTSQGSWDYWAVKINGNGIKIWDKRFGGTDWDKLLSMVATSDGGFLLGGASYSGANGDKSQASQGGSDYWVVKIDGNGSKVWDKRFGGTSLDNLASMVATSDGSFLLGGYSASDANGDKSQISQGGTDYWIIKIDANGNKSWDKLFGGASDDVLYSIVATSDNDFLLGGYSASSATGDKSQASQGGQDYWIVKIKNCLLTAKINTPNGTSFCTGSSVSIAAEGNGTTSPFTYKWKLGSADVGTSATLTVVQAGVYNVEVTDKDGCTVSASVEITQSSNLPVSITGTNNFCVGQSTTLTATASGGTSPYTYQWKQSTVNVGTNANTLTVSAGGSYTVNITDSKGCTGISTGYTVTQKPSPDVTVSKSGATDLLAGVSVVLSVPIASGQTYQWLKDGVAISGATNNSYTAFTVGAYTITVTSNGCSATSQATNVNIITANEPISATSEMLLVVYPNPSFGKTKVSLSLEKPSKATLSFTDALGRNLKQWQLSSSQTKHEIEVDFSAVPSGIYFFQAEANGKQVVKKVVKE